MENRSMEIVRIWNSRKGTNRKVYAESSIVKQINALIERHGEENVIAYFKETMDKVGQGEDIFQYASDYLVKE